MQFSKNLKLYLTVLTILSILFSSISNSKLKRIKSKSKTGINRLSKLSEEISNTFDLQTAKNFRDLAGLGYVDTESATSQLSEIKKAKSVMNTEKVSSLFKILFEQQGWQHIVTKTYGTDMDNYCFSMIKHRNYKKMVIAFTGTKTNAQLKHQWDNSDGMAYKPGKEYIKIMKYFLEMYRKIQVDLKRFYEANKDPAITQYIFVGHSLGGAMASVALFDFMQENLIQKTAISPVLMTYGQPRAGNYAFANELMKKVPIVFRHYNNYDVVEAVPACYTANDRCISEFGKNELDKNFNDYQNFYDTLTEDQKNTYHPFHFSGLVFIKGDQEILDCRTKSEVAPDDVCKGEISFNPEFHTNYFGYQISNIGNPKEFPYGQIHPNFVFGNRQIYKHDNKKKLLWKEIENMSTFRRSVNNMFHTVGTGLMNALGLTHSKKLKK